MTSNLHRRSGIFIVSTVVFLLVLMFIYFYISYWHLYTFLLLFSFVISENVFLWNVIFKILKELSSLESPAICSIADSSFRGTDIFLS